ncbi:MAG: LysR family transcriptional regulator [Alphaproteobacteria bacterium]|nr:LysR family transcriptional regulator [Alphaproteobacteria bacterium]
MERLPSSNGLQAFVAAAHAESFAAAADKLNVTQAAISKQIKNLENIIGAQLFTRHHRRVVLTERGAAFLAVAENAIQTLSAGLDATQEDTKDSELTVEIDHEFLHFWILPRLSALRSALPHCQFSFTAQQFNARNLGVTADIAVHYGRPVHPSLIVETLLDYVAFPVCAPSLIPEGADRSDWFNFSTLPLLHDFTKTWWGEAFSTLGTVWNGSGNETLLGQPATSIEAATRGLGLGIGDDVTCRALIEEGRLARITDAVMPGRHEFYIVRRRNAPPNGVIEPFITWLRDQATEHRAWRERFLAAGP